MEPERQDEFLAPTRRGIDARELWAALIAGLIFCAILAVICLGMWLAMDLYGTFQMIS